MRVIILAGGLGTRIAEETQARPKPMVEIGGKPLLWHLMHIYAAHGYKDFLVACGYRGEVIKEYFRNMVVHNSDFIVDLRDHTLDLLNPGDVDWRVGVIDTGLETMTGGRIRRLQSWVGDGTFLATYGDGVGNVDITRLVAFHRAHGKLATVTAVRPPARFGGLVIERFGDGSAEGGAGGSLGGAVREFSEKPQTGEGWINGGFFVFEPGVFDYLEGDATVLEREPLERLSRDGQLMAYQHEGFWQPMDTLREKQLLDSLWASRQAPWKVW